MAPRRSNNKMAFALSLACTLPPCSAARCGRGGRDRCLGLYLSYSYIRRHRPLQAQKTRKTSNSLPAAQCRPCPPIRNVRMGSHRFECTYVRTYVCMYVCMRALGSHRFEGFQSPKKKPSKRPSDRPRLKRVQFHQQLTSLESFF